MLGKLGKMVKYGALFLLLLACTTGGRKSCKVDPCDADGDGFKRHARGCYARVYDCDDNNATVHPGAVEVCDGIDDNCDGVLLAGEVDADGDGVLVCEGDCNDLDPLVFPGAKEVCDGVDNNCDGVLLDGETVDADSDGFLACNDCDDNNAAVYPGVEAVCDDNDHTCDVNCVCEPNQELVINGGFESPVVGTSQQWDIFDSDQLASWVVEWATDEPDYQGYSRPTEASLELQGGVNGWLPEEGNQYAELDSDWDGPSGPLNGEPASVQIYQDLPTIPGQHYAISFYFSPRPSSCDNALEFSWDNQVQETIIAPCGDNNTIWNQYTYNFTATDSTTRLQFADIGISDSLGTFLDNVSVGCVPSAP